MLNRSQETDLDVACAHALTQAMPWLKGVVHAFFQEAGPEAGVSPSQFFTMCAIGRWGCDSPSGLAQSFHITRPAASALTEGLVSRGLVERRGGQRDRRQVRLVLTPAGRELCERVVGLLERHIGARIARLDIERKERLLAALGDLESALSGRADAARSVPQEGNDG
jgi:DNA-binding MarR family transcriptional regulator